MRITVGIRSISLYRRDYRLDQLTRKVELNDQRRPNLDTFIAAAWGNQKNLCRI